MALALASLSGGSTMAAGPTSWGGGSCMDITAFPANLTHPGVYCLSFKHIDFPMTSGALIKISSNDIVLDLNGATLDGTVANNVATSAWGILSNGYSNITIRNGTIKGFATGIHLEAPTGSVNSRIRPSQSYLIEHVRLINNRSMAIKLIGNDSVIQYNYIAHTGGSADPGLVGSAWGMFVAGDGLRVGDNEVAYTVSNTGSSTGPTYAIYMGGAWNSVVYDNRITEANFGIYSGNNYGKYRNNITVNVDTPFTGGTSIGGNN
jgi:hypothetical protein